MSARERILGRIREALADVPAGETPDDVAVPRRYAGAGPTGTTGVEPGPAETIELLADRLRDYKALVHVIEPAGLARTVAQALEGRKRIIVPDGFPGAAAPTGPEWLREPLTVTDLDTADGVITGCAVAIAETGTIVLDCGPAQGRRALTLVPDYHLCVVHAGQIVPSVPDAIVRLDPTRPLTWISGPSATSDIELNRIEGVHGPRTFEVIIAYEGLSESRPATGGRRPPRAGRPGFASFG